MEKPVSLSTEAGTRKSIGRHLAMALQPYLWFTFFLGIFSVSQYFPMVVQLIVAGAAFVLALRLVPHYCKTSIHAEQERLRRTVREETDPGAGYKHFYRFVGLCLVQYLGFILIANLLGTAEYIPPGAQFFLFGLIWALAFIYLLQHRNPDGSINWK